MKVKNSIFSGFFWKLLERFGTQGIQFVLQIVLARLLDPEHYGVLSLMIIFTSLANVFVQNGFNTSLIQSKEADEDDFSSVFWVTLGISGVLYMVLFFCAPLIARFYNMPEIVSPFRVLALTLFPGAFNSVQIAKVRRELDFKKVFYSSIGAIIVSGITSVILAYMGFGLWALVAQSLINITVSCIVMLFTVRWLPKFVIKWKRIAVLFSFGWKLIVSSLIETLYQDLRSLVIGKKYDDGTLGYYNRGKHFPQFIINSINGTVQAVMLPAMSKKQSEKTKMKELTRTSIMMSSYIIFPMMAGLAAVATPLVSILLTDKWLPSVPYLQIYCFTLAFYPVHSCNLQAINALGRSDVFLKLEIIKKLYGVMALVIAVLFFDSPIAIAATGAFTTIISCFVNAVPNKKLIAYSYVEQLRDILPSALLSAAVFGLVLLIGRIDFGNFAKIFLQIITGVGLYIALSHIFKLRPYKEFVQILSAALNKRRRRS